MSSNQSIVQKADLAFADLDTNGGILNPEQATRFVRKLIQEPTLLRDVRTVTMSAPTRNINKIQFNKRILRAAVSATALPHEAEVSSVAFDGALSGGTPSSGEGDRRAKIVTEQIQLNTSEVIAEVHLPYDVIEDNIEMGNIGEHREGGAPGAGGGLIDTIVQLMAERVALDLEELAIKGDVDTGVADNYLDLQDGYLELIRDAGHISNVGGAAISKTMFKNGMKAMPDQYLRSKAQMAHYVSWDQETEYKDTLADRQTGTGDAFVQGNSPATPFGVPLKAVSLMPDDEGLFTHPHNLLFGIQRRITMEFDKNISSRVFIIVMTARVALQVEETDAGVIYTNIGVS